MKKFQNNLFELLSLCRFPCKWDLFGKCQFDRTEDMGVLKEENQSLATKKKLNKLKIHDS